MKKKSIKANLTTKNPTIGYGGDLELCQESWKIFKIISEFVQGYQELYQIKPAVSIFGSARTKKHHKYYKLAKSIANKLSNSGFSVITGGGGGIMEAANLGAYQGKSASVGLNIILPQPEKFNNYQNISIKCRHFFIRKVFFVKYATAYIVLPGGFGTLDELSEILALVQTNKTKRIPIILVCKDYWQGLINWFKERLVVEKMIDPKDLNLFTILDDPDEILDQVNNYYKLNKPFSL